MDKFEALMHKVQPKDDPKVLEKQEREWILRNSKLIIADAIKRGQSSPTVPMSIDPVKPIKEKSCVICSNVFTPRNHSYVACSDECKKENKRRQKYACFLKRRGELEADCVVCGKTFEKKNGVITCSDECRKKKVSDYKKKMWAEKSANNKKAAQPFIDIIDLYRKKTGESYTDICSKKLGLSAGIIRDWKCGKCLPSPAIQKKIKALLK